MKLRNQIKLHLRRYWHRVYPYTALNGLDKKMLRYLTNTSGFFIEAGANDGVRYSNTYFLEKRRNWTGILVEPIPSRAIECRRNRKSVVEEFVLVPQKLSGSQIELMDLDLMSLVLEQSSGHRDQQQHIHDAEKVQGLRGQKVFAVGIAISEQIQKHGNPQIDFFSLDVEGYEIDVLGGLDLNLHRPLFILIETHNLDGVRELLGELYDVIETFSTHDYLFKLKSGSK